MSPGIAFLAISKPSLLANRIILLSRASSLRANQLVSSSSSFSQHRTLEQSSSRCLFNGQAKNLGPFPVQTNSLVNPHRWILFDPTTKRWFNRKQEYGHRINEDPSKFSVIQLIYVSMMFAMLGYVVFDVEWLWKTYAPSAAVDTWDYIGLRWRKWWREFLRVDAKDSIAKDTKVQSKSSDDEDDEDDDDKKKESKRVGFRDRKIIEYENRMRTYSTPDKIFRYFATIKIVSDDEDVTGGEILMTPDDFLRALTPGLRQPENLGLDQFKKIELTSKEEKKKLEQGLRKDSIFYKLSDYGLINFSDFLFLLTVLSVSRRHFEIAFRMFDLNGDGNVDYKEFEKVQNAILQQTSIGQKLGHSLKGYSGFSSALSQFFFGKDLKQKLTIEKFLDFQSKLQSEMLTLEFNGKRPVDGKITEVHFSELMIAYAGFTESKKARMLNRVKKRYPKIVAAEPVEEKVKGKKSASKDAVIDVEPRGVSASDYLKFFHFLQNISDVDIALTFFNMAGAGIDKETLKHAALTVAKVDLSDHMVDVIFTLFDENQDGSLSNREFISVMKERLRRGLSRPKDTGFVKLVSAFMNAIKIDGILL